MRSGTASPFISPHHGSWLDQAEIEIGLYSRQCLGARRIPDLKTLRRESRAWNRQMNRDKIKIDWKFDRRPRVANSITKGTLSPGQSTSFKYQRDSSVSFFSWFTFALRP